jgi:hypothetical protein
MRLAGKFSGFWIAPCHFMLFSDIVSPVSITAQEIKDVVRVEDDFGHEMRVGNILTNPQYPPFHFTQVRVMSPSHGGTYKDQVTDKTRQFDYRCQIVRGHQGTHNIFLAAECKNLNPDLPLVVCGRPRTKVESYHVYIARTQDGERQLRIVEGSGSLYKPNGFVGKSLIRLKIKEKKLCADGDSEIYDKWSQALASSYDLAFSAAYNKSASQALAFILPLVVVPDNSLWVVSYKDNGTPYGDPEKVDQCPFYVDQKFLIGLPFVITHIHFVTLKGLSDMLSEFANADSDKWDLIFSHASSEYNPTL